MGRINWGRVILGGIVAGIIINISEAILNTVVLGAESAEILRSRNLDPEAQSIPVWFAYGFIVGILLVWLYAAIRPRFGPGPKTALIAGFVVWVLAFLLSTIAMINIGLFPSNMMLMPTIWGFVEVMLAALLGAWLYKEEPSMADMGR
jgi:hypothetical protein